MTPEELKATNLVYDENIVDWKRNRAAYDGADAMVDVGFISKHERESEVAWQRRKAELYGFGYSASVVDLFNHYLFRKPPTREYGDSLASDKLFEAFLDDADFDGNDLDAFLKESARMAGIYGHVGILVDTPGYVANSLADALDHGVYPYLGMYLPTSILDWKHERNEFGRKQLTYLKLYDDQGVYYIWTPEMWEQWEIVENKEGSESVRLVAQGQHDLGEIPFVWVYNSKDPGREVGTSDLQAIAPIDASVIRNLSQAEEVLTFAGFPMLRKPWPVVGESDTVTVGPTSVLEFNPELGEAGKPDILSAQIGEAMSGIELLLERKEKAIYSLVWR